jgi:hypothetical protein
MDQSHNQTKAIVPNSLLLGNRLRHASNRARQVRQQAVPKGEGRVCSSLVHLDLEALRMRTQSGRIYELAGSPGSDGDSDYVFGHWLRAVGAIHCKDLTRALMRLRTMRGAGMRS